MQFNRVYIGGNLTRDPEVRSLPSGTAVCQLGVATNRRYTTQQGEQREDTCFVDVDVFGRQADNCGQYLQKGAPVFIEGRLQMDQWQDRQTGQQRSKLKVHALSVQFLSRGGGQGGGQGVVQGTSGPARGGAVWHTQPMQQPGPQVVDGTPPDDDDIPF